MKKTLLILTVLLMMDGVAFAGGGVGIAIGPKVGYQTSKLSYDKVDINSDFANHFTAGLFGRVNIGHFYIQPEVLYFKTSNIFDATVTGTDSNNLFNLPTGAKLNITLNSMNLQVPVLVGYEFLDLGVLSLRAQVGFTANIILGSQTLYDKTYSIYGENYEIDDTSTGEGFNPKDIACGIQAGLGADVLDFITLDINYNLGLSKKFNTLNGTVLGETFDFSNIESTKQNMFLVTVGIKLVKL